MPHVFTPTERERIVAHNLDLISASKVDITDDMLALAEKLSQIHGRIRVCRESSGIHFYLPCPECLLSDSDEIYKSHLAVNAEKYFSGDDESRERCVFCMKESVARWSVADLLSMPPLNERGHELKPAVVKLSKVNIDSMEYDENGFLIPKGPGEVVPVMDLPKSHPAQMYLRSRQFDAEALYYQFRLSFCNREKPGIWYRRQMHGFRATPQGRIVFFIDINGVNRGWQSRVLDMTKDGIKLYYHPYSNQWVPVLKKVDDKWIPVDEKWRGWDEVKYAISAGCHRNECLLGYDASVAWNLDYNPGKPSWCVLAEGGLDAGRLGAPAMAIMGKVFSEGQAKLVADRFEKVVYVRDSDAAGEQAAKSVIRRFAELKNATAPELKIVSVPDGNKDLGDMSPDGAREFIEETLYA